jgi:hypothetical protein
MLGFIGGKTFADNHFVAFAVAFGCALAVSAVLELVRRARERRKAASGTAGPATDASV